MIVSPSGASNSMSSGRTVTFGIASDQFSICSLGKLRALVGPKGQFAIIQPLYHPQKELSEMVRKNGDIGAVDLVRTNSTRIVRDISIGARDNEHGRCIVDALRGMKGVTIRRVSDPVFLAHDGGKIEVHNKMALSGRGDLSRVYTPGVARVCLAIAANPEAVWSLTIKKNAVAVVT